MKAFATESQVLRSPLTRLIVDFVTNPALSDTKLVHMLGVTRFWQEFITQECTTAMAKCNMNFRHYILNETMTSFVLSVTPTSLIFVKFRSNVMHDSGDDLI